MLLLLESPLAITASWLKSRCVTSFRYCRKNACTHFLQADTRSSAWLKYRSVREPMLLENDKGLALGLRGFAVVAAAVVAVFFFLDTLVDGADAAFGLRLTLVSAVERFAFLAAPFFELLLVLVP